MLNPTPGTRLRRLMLIIAVAQLLAALAASAAWIWCSGWHHAAIYEMSDQLVLDGDITPASAERLRAKYGSIGGCISQGWGDAAALCGWVLVMLCTAAPAVTYIANRKSDQSATPPVSGIAKEGHVV